MKFSTSGYFEAVCVVCLFNTKADVCIQFTEQTVTEMTGSDEFTFLSCKRTVVDNELHCDRRLGNLLELDRNRIVRRADRITDGNICNTGDRNDRTDACFFYFYFIQTVKFI